MVGKFAFALYYLAGTGAMAGNLRSASDDSCNLKIELSDCMVVVDQNGGSPQYTDQQCAAFQFNGLHLEHCTQTPYAVNMLYNGGDCNQSTNSDILDFTCHDSVYDDRAPPVEQGSPSYIVVLDPFDESVLFFEGWVYVGSTFGFGVAAEESLNGGFRIQVYDTDQTSILQEVVYRQPLCHNDMEMLNRFGASQIVSYDNDLQGHVSSFASIGFSVDLTFSVKAEEGDIPASMTTLVAATNFAGYHLDMTDNVSGARVDGEPVTATVRSLPAVQGGEHTVLVTAMADQDGSGLLCTKTELFTFNLDINLDPIS